MKREWCSKDRLFLAQKRLVTAPMVVFSALMDYILAPITNACSNDLDLRTNQRVFRTNTHDLRTKPPRSPTPEHKNNPAHPT